MQEKEQASFNKILEQIDLQTKPPMKRGYKSSLRTMLATYRKREILYRQALQNSVPAGDFNAFVDSVTRALRAEFGEEGVERLLAKMKELDGLSDTAEPK